MLGKPSQNSFVNINKWTTPNAGFVVRLALKMHFAIQCVSEKHIVGTK